MTPGPLIALQWFKYARIKIPVNKKITATYVKNFECKLERKLKLSLAQKSESKLAYNSSANC